MAEWDLSKEIEKRAGRAYQHWDFIEIAAIISVDTQGNLVDQMVLRPAEEQRDREEGTRTDPDTTKEYVLHELSDSMGDIINKPPADKGGKEYEETQH